MNFQTLMAESEVPPDVLAIVDELIVKKSETRELGEGSLPGPIAGFIDSEFREANMSIDERPPAVTDEAREDIDRFFRESLDRFRKSP